MRVKAGKLGAGRLNTKRVKGAKMVSGGVCL